MKTKIAVSMIVLLSFILGCEDNGTIKAKSRNPEINEAREVMSQIIARGIGRPESNQLTAKILDEPDFTGPLREFGGVAIFDSAGNITKVSTMKIVDFKTGRKYTVRQYTEQELAASRDQILRRRAEHGTPIDMAFPIMSESLKLAVAKCVLNESSYKTYTIGRGTGATSQELQVSEIVGSSSKVIASDALYQ